MLVIRHLLCFAFIFLTTLSFAQDSRHFTLFTYTPLNVNPAETGAFSGTFRLGGIYRDQWRSFLDNPYVTPSVYLDAPIIKGFRKNDWIGVGGMVYTDEAGAGELSNSAFLGSASYHMALDRKAKSILSFGLQAGYAQRRVNTQGLTFEDEIDIQNNVINIGSSQDLNGINTDVNYLDIGAGVLLNASLNKKTTMKLGFAVSHLTNPEYGLKSTGLKAKLPILGVLHGQFNVDLNKKWLFSPAFLYQTTSPGQEVNLQLWGGYHFNTAQDVTLRFGTGYRLRDAAKLLLGLDYKDFRIGAAYDINISQLNGATNSVGAFEIALSYIAKIFKSPKVDPVIICPQL